MKSSKSRARRTFKLLVVDDQALDIANLALLANNLGLDTTIVFDGDDAWNVASTESFDLIVLDWNMPVMSGHDFLQKLCEVDLPNRACNIVLYTAEKIRAQDLPRMAQFQVVDIWQKPMGIADMMKKMTEARRIIGGAA